MDNLKIGIIGTGVGVVHTKVVSQFPEISIVAICGQDSQKTQRIAGELKIPFWTTDYKKLLEQPIDIVVIAPPNDFHLPIFMETLNYKKHIILEKPAGTSVSEIGKMISASKTYSKTIVVDHELRFHPLHRKIKNMISNKELGNVSLIQMSYTHNLFSSPNYHFSWMNQKERGGGQLQLMGTHLLDLINYWLNFPKTSDVSIKTTIAIPQRNGADGKAYQVTAEDTFTLNARVGSALISVSNGTRGFGYKGLSFEVHGSQGFLIFDEERGLRFGHEFGKMEPITRDLTETELKEGVFKVGMKYFYKEFAKLLTEGPQESGHADFCTLNQAKVVQEIIHTSPE